ncbi:MAG: hypothetical protein Q4A52_03700 [Bacillota bacterium]|nr:hypothetical protein [Bacillota bacterium]
MKTFKTSTFRVLFNLLQGVMTGALVGLVVGYFTDVPIGIAAGIVMFFLFLWLVVLGGRIRITVDGDRMTVKQGRKERVFDLSRCSIVAKTRHSHGDSECDLQITDDSGHTEDIDCQLLGVWQFEQLLEAIGVTGEHAPVTKLQTKR